MSRTHQYRYHFRQWGIKKRITASEKQDVITALGKRMRSDTTTEDVMLTNSDGDLRKEVDKKQLKRYLQDQIRHHLPTVSARAGV